MSIIASWGSQTANCYVDLTSANSFITTGLIDYSAWSDATTPQRIAALLQATRDIDKREYIGQRYHDTQALRFPRTYRSGYPWRYTSLNSIAFETIDQVRQIQRVQEATCHQAVWLLRFSGRNKHLEARAMGITHWSEATGPVMESVDYTRGGQGTILSPEALTLLRDYLTSRRINRS